MTDPITFASTTPRHALPNLFSAQAQKEFTVNEALARLDTLLHPAIEGIANAPPTSPVDGETWLVGDTPSGAWVGQAGKLAGRQSGNWVFAAPRAGMRLFDKAAGQQALFDGSWRRAAAIAAPTGGSVTDVEARTAIAGLVTALVAAGILSD
ncbi:DUF2793 domain-containing protein [Aurantiacibacter luteus]|uniref:DUF2793 domain-containing protein n=1 Tax=Aurantiacibacter luteus TaxID=1581420 RepID=A0A0G9MUS3_9SPHN|nr:DUF2793 domain-containing protein [Aurantiacibacter luteus]KLE34455.1 hypothetical protein AAW00_09545 [Aurantiacibacter luteus]